LWGARSLDLQHANTANQKGVYYRDHPYRCRDRPYTLTVPDGWACCRAVFVWKNSEIFMIRVRAGPL